MKLSKNKKTSGLGVTRGIINPILSLSLAPAFYAMHS